MNDYLIIDEQGIKEVHCMNCDVMIRERREYKGEQILRTLANYAFDAELQLEADGKPHSVAHPAICKDCHSSGIDNIKVMKQMRKGWIIEMKDIEKKPQKERAERLQNMSKIKIHKHVRRAG